MKGMELPTESTVEVVAAITSLKGRNNKLKLISHQSAKALHLHLPTIIKETLIHYSQRAVHVEDEIMN